MNSKCNNLFDMAMNDWPNNFSNKFDFLNNVKKEFNIDGKISRDILEVINNDLVYSLNNGPTVFIGINFLIPHRLRNHI